MHTCACVTIKLYGSRLLLKICLRYRQSLKNGIREIPSCKFHVWLVVAISRCNFLTTSTAAGITFFCHFCSFTPFYSSSLLFSLTHSFSLTCMYMEFTTPVRHEKRNGKTTWEAWTSMNEWRGHTYRDERCIKVAEKIET